MNDIFSEAEEELKEARFYQNVKRVAITFTILAIVIVISVFTYSFIQNKEEEKSTISASKFISFFNEQTGEIKNLDELLKFANENDDAYNAAAGIIAGNQSLKKADKESFIKSMETVLKGNYEQFFKDVASLNLTNYFVDIDINTALSYINKVDIDNSLLRRFFILSRATIYIKKKEFTLAEADLKLLIEDNDSPSSLKKIASRLTQTIPKAG